jgi:hypothetical protein
LASWPSARAWTTATSSRSTSAENLALAELPTAELPRNETIVLYSEGGIHAAQAWFLLKAKGYPSVYNLKGGLEGWKEEVLFPVSPENPTPEQQAAFERIAAVSRFFGGQPRSGGAAATAPAMELPKLAPPAAPGPGSVGAPKRGKKEGC